MSKTTQKELATELAKQLRLEPQQHSLSGFAEACFNDCSLAELVEAYQRDSADETDCKAWQMTAEQSRAAIAHALEFALFLAITE